MFSDMVLFIFVRFFADFWRFWRKNGKKWKLVFLSRVIYARFFE